MYIKEDETRWLEIVYIFQQTCQLVFIVGRYKTKNCYVHGQWLGVGIKLKFKRTVSLTNKEII
jgi:hypothetical protein